MKLAEVGEHIIEMKTDIKWIKKSLDGNGSRGLLNRVASLEQKQYYYMGAMAVVFTLINYGVYALL